MQRMGLRIVKLVWLKLVWLKLVWPKLVWLKLVRLKLVWLKLISVRLTEHQTERQTEPGQVWILFHGDNEPLPLNNLTFAQEMRLEQGWPYTYVRQPAVKDVKLSDGKN